MNRRHFLGALTSAIVVARRFGYRQSGALGVRLSTARAAFAGDPEHVLASVAGLGYREVELYQLYGPHGWPAARLRAALDAAGLVAPAVEVSMPLLYRGLERHVEVAAALGCTYVVCAGVDAEERRALRDWHELAGVYNRAGETARRAGVRVAYRTHDYDLVPVEGHVPYDVLVAETDPALVWFELDAPAARDPIAVLTAHGGRFASVDLGDCGAATSLLSTARSVGVRHCFVDYSCRSSPSTSKSAQSNSSSTR